MFVPETKERESALCDRHELSLSRSDLCLSPPRFFSLSLGPTNTKSRNSGTIPSQSASATKSSRAAVKSNTCAHVLEMGL